MGSLCRPLLGALSLRGHRLAMHRGAGVPRRVGRRVARSRALGSPATGVLRFGRGRAARARWPSS
eukprot:408561-Alexandrium_andersonii.AAC.1